MSQSFPVSAWLFYVMFSWVLLERTLCNIQLLIMTVAFRNGITFLKMSSFLNWFLIAPSVSLLRCLVKKNKKIKKLGN